MKHHNFKGSIILLSVEIPVTGGIPEANAFVARRVPLFVVAFVFCVLPSKCMNLLINVYISESLECLD